MAIISTRIFDMVCWKAGADTIELTPAISLFLFYATGFDFVASHARLVGWKFDSNRGRLAK
jgi:hypothetical protein